MPFLNKASKKIYYRMWDAEYPKANIIFFHGVGEHSGLYHRFAHDQNAQGNRVWAIDHTAHGHTPGRLVEAYDMEALALNAMELIETVRKKDSLPIILMGNSLGGILASYMMSREGVSDIKGLVLTSTPLELIPELEDPDSIVMSLDEAYLDELQMDPILPKEEIKFSELNDGVESACKLALSKMNEWSFPVLFLNGDSDPVAPFVNSKEWAKRVQFGKALVIKDGHHDLINDLSHKTVARLVSDFVHEVTNERIGRL